MRLTRWTQKTINMLLIGSLLLPTTVYAEVGSSLSQKPATDRAKVGTTKDWISAYQTALQAKDKQENIQPDEKTTYTKEKIKQLDWDTLQSEQVWKLYQTADPALIQFAAYFYPSVDRFLSHNEQVEKYKWNDDDITKRIQAMPLAKKEQLKNILPQLGAVLSASEAKPLPPKQTEKPSSTSALASIPDAMYDPEGLTYQYKRSNTDNPVDELYRTANVRELDIQLEGKHGLDFTLERSYSSLEALTEEFYYSNSGKNVNIPSRHLEKNFLPIGWKLNLPRFEEIYKSNAWCSYYDDTSKYNCGYEGEGKRYVFTLDDGTVLESSSTVGDWVNTPYQGISMSKYKKGYGEFGTNHVVTLAKNGITYDFGEESHYYKDDLYHTFLVKKTNAYGDSISYRINEDTRWPTEITDSVGRLITIDNSTVNTVVKVYQDSSQKTLLKHFVYEWNISTNKDRIKEYSVTGTDSKIIAEYAYHSPSVYGVSEYNLQPTYSFAAPNKLINFNDNGLESTEYTNVDKTKKGKVNYKLLKQVDYPVEGLSMSYTYSLYQPDVPGFLNQGLVRLYLDKEALTYMSYHPVTAVNFQFAKTPHPDQLTTGSYSYTKYYPQTNKEIWKSPKSASVRFANQPINRDGSRVVTRSVQDGLPSVEKTFIVNPDRNFLLQSVKTFVGNGADSDTIQGALTLTEDGKTYRYAPASYTSYMYNQRETQPTHVYSFMGRPSSLTADSDVYQYLLAPTDSGLSKVKARLGRYAQIVEYGYNVYGDVTKEIDPKGNKTTTEYVTPDSLTSLRVPSKVKKTAASNPNHYHEETYTYGSNRLVATEKIVDSYPDGTAIRQEQVNRTYSYQDKLLKTITETSTGPDAKTITQSIDSYDDFSLYPREITMQVETSTGVNEQLYHYFHYDGMGRLQYRMYPDEIYVQYQYDLLGRRTKELVTNRDQTRTTTYDYDDTTRKVTMTLPDGTKQFSHFTPYGEVEYKGQIGKDGTVRPLLYNTYSLDGNHLLSSAPYALNERATSYVYNADGTVWKKTDPIGTTVFLAANTQNDGVNYVPARTGVSIEPNGLQTTQYYDRHGQLEKEVLRTGDGSQSRTTQLARNDFDQVIGKTEKDQTGKSRVWEYRSNNDGKLVYLLDPEQNKYQYEYDTLGNLVTVTENQLLTTRNHYNALSWKISEKDVPSGATESYRYNRNGTPHTFTDKAGIRHLYAYTPFNELSSLTSTNAAGKIMNLETKEYVPNTSLIQKEMNSNGTDLGTGMSNYREVSYTYDPFLRLKTQTAFGRVYEMGYTDRDDLMDSLTYPDNAVVTYLYDAAGRLKEVNSAVTGKIEYSYQVDTTGDSYQAKYPNGRINKRKADSFGQVATVTHENNQAPIWSESNQYSFGNVVSIQRNAKTHQYTYDKIDRLTKEVIPGTTNDYSYDGRGNRSAFAGTLPTETGSATYTFDERNRLRSVVNETTGDTSTYTYYGDGLRASKTENGIQTKYVYLSGKVIEELDAANASKARNIWGNELVLRKDMSTGKSGYYHYNSHGDVVAISDGTGQELNSYAYDTWGNVISKTEGMSNPYQYSGEPYDEKTGFYYLRARYYDPKVGRFISEDTYKGAVDNPLSLNRYAYVSNNPLRFVDPSGHVACEGAIGGCNKESAGGKYYKDIRDLTPEEQIQILEDPRYSDGDKIRVGLLMFARTIGLVNGGGVPVATNASRYTNVPAKLPQGVAGQQFSQAAVLIRERVGSISSDIFVQGSRAKGTATASSDIDFGIRVSTEKFNDLIKTYFGTPNSGSAKERTMLHAIQTGKIQAGEAKLSSLRIQLEQTLGIKVDISIIREGSVFDKGPYINLP
ncbi:RHS repeat-associated core domain-containing protein [Brevibacillus reuszeri]|uniref:RHS repeat-associated core domain-containing protein n=1 Tax=Brevibacillus reuszeri TaxID=54915 RepID=UPI003672CB09